MSTDSPAASLPRTDRLLVVPVTSAGAAAAGTATVGAAPDSVPMSVVPVAPPPVAWILVMPAVDGAVKTPLALIVPPLPPGCTA